jgi:uroporphyrinogen III methyltransferase/synthase
VTVYLVGAGPGDPGLLTVRGAEVLARADTVVYDRLSVAALLDLAPAGAERISVGKTPGVAGPTQEQINDLLVEHGRTGKEVVRLKGGDPFVFARGGEEAQALAAAGVPFEIVPGITSAVAVPAYAGIPLTMRHSSTLFTVITGHEDPDKQGEIDWEAVAGLGGTIVVLMGVGRLPKIVDRLKAGGLPGDTPVAAIRWGTRPEQHTVRATLDTVLQHDLEAPSTIVIGRVAALDLAWFEQRPLFGRTVVVTRAAAQAGPLVARLRAAGAEPLVVPTIEIGEPADGGAGLRKAASDLSEGVYDWLVVTSANGATRMLGELHDARDLGGVKVAAIGPATADAVAHFNVTPDLVPDTYVAEALVEAFPAPADGDHGRVLLARAATAREVLPEGLRAMGWQVDVVEAYRTHRTEIDEDTRMQVLDADAITFTASSTVDSYVRTMNTVETPPVVAVIGPITADTARGHGIHVDVEATEHTIDGLVAALEAHFTRP